MAPVILPPEPVVITLVVVSVPDTVKLPPKIAPETFASPLELIVIVFAVVFAAILMPLPGDMVRMSVGDVAIISDPLALIVEKESDWVETPEEILAIDPLACL